MRRLESKLSEREERRKDVKSGKNRESRSGRIGIYSRIVLELFRKEKSSQYEKGESA